MHEIVLYEQVNLINPKVQNILEPSLIWLTIEKIQISLKNTYTGL
jgi:hypothetical protein